MTASPVARAYDGAVEAWLRGPEAVYGRLAEALLDRAPIRLSRARVLDLGAGTGVAAGVALAGGAGQVVACDIAIGMLRHRGPGIAAVGADAARLPFAGNSFDLAVAALCLGHLPDPAGALVEMRRVASAVVASAFAPGWTHPAKAAVDEAMAAFGYVVPPWYREVKEHGEPLVADPEAFARLASAAGFTDVRVERVEVDSGLGSAAEVAQWRLGMAHLAPFVATLEADQAARARAAAREAVAGTGPVVIPLLVLSAC